MSVLKDCYFIWYDDYIYSNCLFTLIFCRSRFYDEDGDLAHEFYEERDIGGHSIMEQHWRNLTPEVSSWGFFPFFLEILISNLTCMWYSQHTC